MEIDHVYICTQRAEEAAEELARFGLTEGSSNTHPGQGTANRRFFFHNSMLEILYSRNEEELKSDRTKVTHLYEQCVECKSSTSPFGLVFRPTAESEKEPPFPYDLYYPEYLPEPLFMHISSDRRENEPNFFYLNFARKKGTGSIKEPLEHRYDLKKITSCTIQCKGLTIFSKTADTVNRLENVKLIASSHFLMELEFDNGTNKESCDFRPLLPLLIKW